ncbi:hypothetical protein KNO81_31220 [Paraburkholderia sediminicola]|nr:hypothetical protein [Paraburkholderia sediminicola]
MLRALSAIPNEVSGLNDDPYRSLAAFRARRRRLWENARTLRRIPVGGVLSNAYPDVDE